MGMNKTPSVALALGIAITMSAVAGCGSDNSANATVPTVVLTSAPPTTTASTAAPTTVATTAVPTQPPDPTTATSDVVATPPPDAAPSTPAPNPGEGVDDPNNGGTPAPTAPGMTIEAITALLDPNGESSGVEAVAWGDVDGDGDDDAVVRTGWCGASCGTQLDLVLNNNSTPTIYEYTGSEAFEPWYLGAGAAQSSLTSASIVPGTVTLVGTGLCGAVPVTETDEPGSCNYNTERTAIYTFADGVLAPASISPEPG